MNPAVERAQFYIQQGRYQEAIKELLTAMSQDPDDPTIRGLLALCFMHTGERKKAVEEAERGIALAPDYAWVHYILAVVQSNMDRWKQAEVAIRRAIELEPDDARYYGVLASIYANAAKWRACVETCEIGLSLDPDNETCRTLRTHAMALLGDKSGAYEAAIQSVMDNPDSPDAHGALGWVSLRAGKRAEAIQHFKEALRIDPEDEMAKDGLLESLRTGFPPYRFMFGVTQYIARLPGQYQWVAVFGIYMIGRLASRTLRENRHLWPFLVPVITIIGLFFLMRWFGHPITNAILLFHPLGRLALGPTHRREAMLFGGFLLAGPLLLLISFATPLKVWPGGMFAIITAVLLGLCHSFESSPKLRAAGFWVFSIFGAIATVLGAVSGALNPS